MCIRDSINAEYGERSPLQQEQEDRIQRMADEIKERRRRERAQVAASSPGPLSPSPTKPRTSESLPKPSEEPADVRAQSIVSGSNEPAVHPAAEGPAKPREASCPACTIC
eukprot:TRINITY_DN4805_c0_g1_i3.p1 TRINITY_DN4805_c0_g1~~TRINITY_DN4805_c0_g1_i3.p1  ORF type:complete len:110 (+),score=21.51 TRINITY_DN4805_c0_g1_i3:141-470(+)